MQDVEATGTKMTAAGMKALEMFKKIDEKREEIAIAATTALRTQSEALRSFAGSFLFTSAERSHGYDKGSVADAAAEAL